MLATLNPTSSRSCPPVVVCQACSTASAFAREMPPMPRTGSQYSLNLIDSCGSRNAYVSWLRNRPAWISATALSLSDSAFRHSRPSASLPHDQTFLAGQVGGRRVVHDAGLRPRVIDPHERLAAAVAEERHRPLPVIPGAAQIDARGVHRPGVHVREPVAGGVRHRVAELRVVPHLHCRVGPPVEAVPHVAPVVERRALLERARFPAAASAPPATACRRRGPRCRPRSTRCRQGWSRLAKSTGETVTQVCDTGKLNSMP